MDKNNRPASQHRRRSILTTTSSGGASPELNKNNRSSSITITNRNKKGSHTGPGYYEKNQINFENLNHNSNDPTHTTPSVFRSPSMEEKLAQFGISINLSTASSPAGGGTMGSWKHMDNLNNSSGGESGRGGGGSGRSVNSMGGEIPDVRKDLTVRKSTRLSSDISKRISGISSSMEVYDRKVRNVQETMQAAYKNTVQDRKNLRKSNESQSPLGERSSPDSGSIDLSLDTDAFLQKCTESLKKDLLSDFDNCSSFNVGPGSGGDNNNNNGGGTGTPNFPPSGSETSSPRKVFGLDAAASKSAVKSAAIKRFEENIKNRNKQQQEQKSKDGRPPLATRAKKKHRKQAPNDLLPPRSLSPIMPTVPDKQFQTILERREERDSRHLTSMKNEIAQLNHKVEMDKKKASASSNQKTRGTMPHSYKGCPMRVMKNPPDKSLGNELNSFVQSTGGKAGGWERKDHNCFVKIFDVWKKHPNKLMEALKKELPNKKPQEIASHINWFERFEQLNSANRANVYRWSQDQRKGKEEILKMGNASQRAKLEGDKRRNERLQMIRELERDRGKEQLAQWKRTQAVRTTPSATSSQAAQCANSQAVSSTSAKAFSQHHQQHMFQDKSNTEPRQRPKTPNTGNVDIAGISKHIIEITAQVHALHNPKRDFRPPRPPADMRRNRSRQGEQQEVGLRENTNLKKLEVTRSFTDVMAPHPPPSGSSMIFAKGETNTKISNRIKLPGIEPDPPRSRATSSIKSRPLSTSLRNQELQKNKESLAELRERDKKIVEARKVAVSLANDRRKSNLSKLTAADMKQRIRRKVREQSTFSKPTKQSELKKTITHLERLEMLSRKDLNTIAGTSYEKEGGRIMSPSVMMINNLPSKGIPNWRKSIQGDGGVTGNF